MPCILTRVEDWARAETSAKRTSFHYRISAEPYGKRCAALDLNELFKSEKIHCPQCQVREKAVQDEKGEKRMVREYYQQAVALSWMSGSIPPRHWMGGAGAGGGFSQRENPRKVSNRQFVAKLLV